jgi:hypothetical protein
MTQIATSLAKIRIYLRDMDGDVWSDGDLGAYWNQAQLEIAQKTGILEKAEAYRYPSEYTMCYMRDWEKEFTEGDQYQCMIICQQTGDNICYPWETGFWFSTPDYGDRFTHTWESFYSSNPGSVVPVVLNSHFNKMKFLAWDELPLPGKNEREIAAVDPYYQTCSGTPQYYYRVDDYTNQIVLYPRPSDIRWEETTEGDVFDDDGGLVTDAGWLDETGLGLATDVIETEDALFCFYEAIPWEITDWTTSEFDFEDWMAKYIEYATLERAFGADTDGFIPTLRDYWKQRKEIGIQAILKFKRMRLKDRDFQLGAGMKVTQPKHGRLPAGYPAI